jgi:hypothetical protein
MTFPYSFDPPQDRFREGEHKNNWIPAPYGINFAGMTENNEQFCYKL